MLRFCFSLRSAAGLAVALPLILVLAACGPNGGTGGTGGAAGTGGAGGGGVTSSTGVTGTGGQGGAGGAAVVPDTTPPKVISTIPVDDAHNVASNSAIAATFSEAMNPLTITDKTFTLKLGADDVPGVVAYFNNTTTLLPTKPLELGLTYTATISAKAADLAGNPLAAPYSWKFTTNLTAPKGPGPVLLGAAGEFTILA